ncbi:aminotransferase class III-fold pyridoxal phosphate-dependent enzyme [Conexibacter stalactiti]|uniref:Aminotransferase class III-fold pyridoxal phosphate-dependent enzyme n=1 Tax=Conexibacter stalactiti TaxID=1940611 RepID=A0ABU4HN24_9ACTN|nr:aminotransferase class III-fold pyridoxal phosphate-dependent enzyme [Conexibacter stalactiti]MDW5593449.1 aminotransferase class III-fold pyridoxal phosphate-dependent enzyme [Conexibacter stalactiti]MEC5034090.1 aminotransferase class III-fold pyridoxal phosphate-dependent enzyme [Conexibacter stalactiti]
MNDTGHLQGASPLWHPFADMGAVARDKLVLERADGIWAWDAEGRRYLDATASLWYANLGHARDEIAAAIADQLGALDAYSIFGDYANQPALELAERLAALAPSPGMKVFLGSGGGDMVDTAVKVVRAHFAQTGQPQRTHLISRTHGYHGTHGLGTSVGGIPANTGGWGPLVTDVSVVPHDDAAALEREIERVGTERVAAFFCEPVIGAGGVRHAPAGYIEAVAEICKRHGVLFVADCVISGFGRLGTWWGIDRWPVQPDLITVAKGLTNGVLPVGALLVAEHVAAPFFPDAAGAPVLRHGPTYAGHPVCCAAALAALDVYERDDVIRRGRDLEDALAAVLRPLAEHPLVGEVRAGLGLMAAIELSEDVLRAAPDAPARWVAAGREAGVLVRPLAGAIALSPPLVIEEDEIALLGTRLANSLELLSDALAPAAARSAG